MARLNNAAFTLSKEMNKEEQEKALSILEILNNLEVERASWILHFCKEAIKSNAVVKIEINRE